MTKEYAEKRIKDIDKATIKLFDNYLEMLDKEDKKPETVEDYSELLDLLDSEIKKIIERIKSYNSEREMLIQIITNNGQNEIL